VLVPLLSGTFSMLVASPGMGAGGVVGGV